MTPEWPLLANLSPKMISGHLHKMSPLTFFIVKFCQSGQTPTEYLKKCQKNVKIKFFGSNLIFDLIFSGYDLLV